MESEVSTLSMSKDPDEDVVDDDVPEGFKPFTKNSRAFLHQDLAVRLNVSSESSKQFLLSPNALAALGEPEAIRYFYNEDTDQVAFAGRDEVTGQTYAVNNSTVSATGLLSRLGLNPDENWYFSATTHEERPWLLIDLSELREHEEERGDE